MTGEFKNDDEKQESLRFNYEHIGDLCQGDVLNGKRWA